jgi:ribosomal protein S18 acetylase RimI-like enzyme
MLIRRLAPSDATTYVEVRLQALRDAPSAFAVSYEEESANPISQIEAMLRPQDDRAVFGAFINDQLVGMAALGREGLRNLSHKAFVWGMYVAPTCRNQGIGRSLLMQALYLAREVPGVTQVNLCVNVGNATAIALYESLGFQVFGREAAALMVEGKFHDDLHMVCRVGAPLA